MTKEEMCKELGIEYHEGGSSIFGMTKEEVQEFKDALKKAYEKKYGKDIESYGKEESN